MNNPFEEFMSSMEFKELEKEHQRFHPDNLMNDILNECAKKLADHYIPEGSPFRAFIHYMLDNGCPAITLFNGLKMLGGIR